MFSTTKIQILKAIHNPKLCDDGYSAIVFDYKDTNFESNSQHNKKSPFAGEIVFDYKDTNFESNSQPLNDKSLIEFDCFRLQRYKF